MLCENRRSGIIRTPIFSIVLAHRQCNAVADRVDARHADLDVLSQMDDVGRRCDVAVGRCEICTSPSCLMPISTNAPKAVMLVTMPGSVMPSRRSATECTSGSNENACSCSRGSRPPLVERFENVRHGRQPHLGVHVSFGFYAFAQLLVRQQLLDRHARVGGHPLHDMIRLGCTALLSSGFLPPTTRRESRRLLVGFGAQTRHFQQAFSGL